MKMKWNECFQCQKYRTIVEIETKVLVASKSSVRLENAKKNSFDRVAESKFVYLTDKLHLDSGSKIYLVS